MNSELPGGSLALDTRMLMLESEEVGRHGSQFRVSLVCVKNDSSR
ncbi:hypothetical protein [Saltatorellus ferox]